MTLELLTAPRLYLMRVGHEHRRHGDPYELTALVEIHGTVAEIKGATGRLMEIPAMRAEMKRLGVKTARWHRSIGGEMIQHTMEVD